MKKNLADYVGIVSSSLCLIHCMGFPFFIAFGFGISDFHWMEYVFVFISCIAVFRVTSGMVSSFFKIFFWSTFFAFLTTLFLKDDYEFLIIANYIFGGMLISGHLINLWKRGQVVSEN